MFKTPEQCDELLESYEALHYQQFTLGEVFFFLFFSLLFTSMMLLRN